MNEKYLEMKYTYNVNNNLSPWKNTILFLVISSDKITLAKAVFNL